MHFAYKNDALGIYQMNDKTDKSFFDKAAKAWQKAAKEFGIDVVCPYHLVTRFGSVDCLAFLPHFGGANGMLIDLTSPPDFATDEKLTEVAKKTGLKWSFLNAEVYGDYDNAVFREALIDWGYFGDEKNRPRWMPPNC